MAGAVATSAGSPTPFAPHGPSGSGSSIRCTVDLRHVADGRDQVVVQVVGAAVDVLLHQRHADPLGDAAVDLAFDQRRIDRPADVVRRVDVEQLHRAELEIDLDLGDLRREAVGRVRDALPVGVERDGRRVEVTARRRRGRPRVAAPARGRARARCRRQRPTRRCTLERERDGIVRAIGKAETLEQLAAAALRPRRAPRCPRRRSGATPTTCRRRRCGRCRPSPARTHASGKPTASANICGMIVAVPWPISCAPL